MAKFGHETFIVQSNINNLTETVQQFGLNVIESSLTGCETQDYDRCTGDEISGPELSVTVAGNKKSLIKWLTHEARQISGGAQSTPSDHELEEWLFEL